MRCMVDLDLRAARLARSALRPVLGWAALALAVACAMQPAGPPDGDGVASAAEASAEQVPVRFDGERALDHVRTLVEMGPRPAGSEALEGARVYIETTLEGYGLEVRRDEFVADTPLGDIPMANLIAEVEAQDGADDLPVVLIAGHYDTKLFEGFEFVGANDGGSSTALLLELGRLLSGEPPPLPVWLVFFDGEEALVRWTDDDSIYGSRHLASRLAEEGRLQEIGALVLVDMVGDEDLRLVRDGYSTDWLVELFWETAAALGHGDHFGSRVSFIADDHLPFLEAGVPSIDLIDFDYGPGNRYWHSPFDTIEQLSADSLQMVGEVVLAALPALRDRLRAAADP